MLQHFRDPFVRQATAILAEYPELSHEWHERGGEAKLVFPPTAPDGFEVWAVASDTELIVGGEGAHHHFEYDDGSIEASVAAALGLVRDLLSPAMRLREFLAGEVAYRWVLESRVGNQWRPDEESGTIFYNWLAPRRERVRQNRRLPPREIAG